MKKTIKKSDGFTLIELAIVVTIIGILAAIIVPNYFKLADRAKNAIVRENIHVVQTAMEGFSIENLGTYPFEANDVGLRVMLPHKALSENPFDNAPSPLAWYREPAPGEIAISNLPRGRV